MSCDFLEDLDNDENGSSLSFVMNSSGHAFLSSNGENKNYYHFTSDKSGWDKAERVVIAIKEWLDHSKRQDFNLNGPRYSGKVIEKDDCCVLDVNGTEYELLLWNGESDKEDWGFYVGKFIEVVAEVKENALRVSGINPIIEVWK